MIHIITFAIGVIAGILVKNPLQNICNWIVAEKRKGFGLIEEEKEKAKAEIETLKSKI